MQLSQNRERVLVVGRMYAGMLVDARRRQDIAKAFRTWRSETLANRIVRVQSHSMAVVEKKIRDADDQVDRITLEVRRREVLKGLIGVYRRCMIGMGWKKWNRLVYGKREEEREERVKMEKMTVGLRVMERWVDDRETQKLRGILRTWLSHARGRSAIVMMKEKEKSVNEKHIELEKEAEEIVKQKEREMEETKKAGKEELLKKLSEYLHTTRTRIIQEERIRKAWNGWKEAMSLLRIKKESDQVNKEGRRVVIHQAAMRILNVLR